MNLCWDVKFLTIYVVGYSVLVENGRGLIPNGSLALRYL